MVEKKYLTLIDLYLCIFGNAYMYNDYETIIVSE